MLVLGSVLENLISVFLWWNENAANGTMHNVFAMFLHAETGDFRARSETHPVTPSKKTNMAMEDHHF